MTWVKIASTGSTMNAIVAATAVPNSSAAITRKAALCSIRQRLRVEGSRGCAGPDVTEGARSPVTVTDGVAVDDEPGTNRSGRVPGRSRRRTPLPRSARPARRYFSANAVVVAAPAGFVMMIVPDVAFGGTTTTSFDGVTILYLAGTPLNVTDVVPLKFLPVIVTDDPALPFLGVTVTIAGTGAEIGRKPYFLIVAWPAGLSTLSMNACAAALFELFETIAIAYADLRLRPGGHGDHRHVARHRLRVGRVDEAGVGLAERTFERTVRTSVSWLTTFGVTWLRQAHLVEHLQRVGADRHGGAATSILMPGFVRS